MFALLDIRTIAAFVFNIQITIQLQLYPIVFRTAHLCPITPGGSYLDIANLALLGTGGADGYGTWFASKKLLKHVEFTGSDDVWGEMVVGRFVLRSGKRSSENFRRPCLCKNNYQPHFNLSYKAISFL